MTGAKYRITVLTGRLLRLEYQEDGQFTDELTVSVANRDFPDVSFTEKEEDGSVLIETEYLLLSYDKKPFSSTGLSVQLKENGKIWHYGIVFGNSDRNLLGTARTLDETDGYVRLEDGIFGENGFALIDDSASAIKKGEEFACREYEETDLYFFGYGTDFLGGLKDFYTLFGKAPALPRYALGNWWSRYYPYSDEEYRKLLDNFKEEAIPLSVAVLDMDWHVTEVDEKYGTGWTGFTWNKKLFPDHKAFLSELKKRGLAVTLNLHPADGIRAFEDMYKDCASEMGIDPKTEKPVEFDMSDPKFRQVYFEKVLHPYEDEGVDFWWIDWQQGTGRKSGEVDPLFLLNHYHYKDQEGRNVRPMIFSRYAGVGSHRYPVGFSGDTHITWKSLNFQPYFTSTASNIGYGWWSHDIGGHMLGNKDNERLVRWIQFGVFSPIMRIHSSNSPFMNKEPWTLGEPWHETVRSFLRLRHRLIPYLYTMMELSSREGRPLISPMYYICPEDRDAYCVHRQYGFGTELIAAAITEPIDSQLRMAGVSCLIPEGRWYDIFTGLIYQGRKRRKLYRKTDSIPVLLKAGGIVPESLSDRENGTDNPESLRLLIGGASDGSFTLYEDDGCTMAYQNGSFVRSEITVSWDENAKETTVRIKAAIGDISLIPKDRTISIMLYGMKPEGKTAEVYENGSDTAWTFDNEKCIISLSLDKKSVAEERTVVFKGFVPAENDCKKRVFELLDEAWISNSKKEEIYSLLTESSDFETSLSGADLPEIIKDAIREITEPLT